VKGIVIADIAKFNELLIYSIHVKLW